jgi:hypothetical protein
MFEAGGVPGANEAVFTTYLALFFENELETISLVWGVPNSGK